MTNTDYKISFDFTRRAMQTRLGYSKRNIQKSSLEVNSYD